MKDIIKRTKILVTLGPATNSPEKIKALIEAGANGFRLNFSHGSYEERLDQIKWIRDASRQIGRPVAILQDLQGPKIRLGVLKDNHFDVKAGSEIVLDHAIQEHDGSANLPIQYNLADKVKVGEPVYLFDGKIRGHMIERVSDTAIKVRIDNDGFLMSRKGLNLPDTDFGGDIITPKDMADIEFGADKDIDFVALSFIQSADDVNNLRQILVSQGSTAQIIAKIETKAAIEPETLKEIVKAADGVMVARGDMAVETSAEIVPIVEREIIRLCRKYGKLSIVATQMMASMVDSPEPTRAEVSDVATAAILGTDVVMLSDETANGNYPVETVKMMANTVRYTQSRWPMNDMPIEEGKTNRRRNAIAHAAVEVAERVDADFIIAETKSGATAARIAALRPELPIIAVTPSPRVAQQLALSYATRSYVRDDEEHAGVNVAKELLTMGKYSSNGRLVVVVVSGRQPGATGGTDTLCVRVIE
ncbi:pyruvate kinase [TM7 phylum sp. oral taxon 349]|jgi:pyruvate kinase|nr:pyruvate kinase [TM7 phylum sp. oral taxon 349]